MRPWTSLLLLGVGLTVGFAGPAAANTMTPRSPVVVVHNGHVHALLRHHRFFRGRPGLGPFVFGTPLVSPDAYYGSGIASSALPFIMPGGAPVMAAPVAQLPAVEQRPSVETTAEGVVIVRGPGSHHIGY
jgi:hypothetical protein